MARQAEAVTWLLVNRHSGSFSEDRLAQIVQAFAGSGCNLSRTLLFPDDPLPNPARLAAAGVERLAIFTGDGTINSAVAALHGWGGEILVLPGGTMNLLSHRLHGPADAESIIAAVGAGQGTRQRPTILRTAQGDALAGLMAGPGTAWNQVREALRRLDVVALAESVAEAIRESLQAERVRLIDPHLGRAEGYAMLMATPTAKGIAVDGYYAAEIGDVAAQAVALARRNFREGPHDRLGVFPACTMACDDGEPLDLLLDGEPARGDERQRIVLARCGVDLTATAPQEIA